MQPAANATVFIVDDDAGVRDALAWLLRTRRLHSETFDSAEAFAAMLAQRTASGGPLLREAGCLLLDVRMPGISGLTVLDQLVAQGVDQPVIMLTGHGTVEMCRRAFKSGAAEFLEKPVDDEALLEALQNAVRQHVKSRERHQADRAARERFAQLSAREREVLTAVLFLVGPLLVVVPLSLTSGSLLLYPLPGLSWRWYEEVLTDPLWTGAMLNTLLIGLPTTVLATVLGTLAAFGLQGLRSRWRPALIGLLLSPLVLPVIVYAVAAFYFFARIGL
eukprot:gene48025-58825_t